MSHLPNWKNLTKQERIEMIHPCLKLGYSASQIANKFYDCTRNAIIGYIDRHDLRNGSLKPVNSLEKPIKNTKPNWIALLHKEKLLTLTPLLKSGLSIVDVTEEFINVKPASIHSFLKQYPKLRYEGSEARKKITAEKRALAPVRKTPKPYSKATPVVPNDLRNSEVFCMLKAPVNARLVKLFELEENQCKWPLYKDNDPKVFCGADVGERKPYCEHHANFAFANKQARNLAGVHKDG